MICSVSLFLVRYILFSLATYKGWFLTDREGIFSFLKELEEKRPIGRFLLAGGPLGRNSFWRGANEAFDWNGRALGEK